jgi:hypothetical protein
MQITESELRRLNFYRASELHGGLLLGRLAQRVRDPELMLSLTRHGAEEIGHAQVWTETILAVGGRPKPTRDTYQARYARALGPLVGVFDVLALTQVFERRVARHFVEHARRPDTHPAVRQTLLRLVDEEKSHLSWVRRWLDDEEARGRDVEAALARFRDVDARVYQALATEYEYTVPLAVAV